MSGSVNKALLCGNVGSDPEIRNLSNGDKVASFRLATSETWKANGERKERTTWHQIVIFNQHLIGLVEGYVKKGSKVWVEGAIQTREYEKDGGKRYVTEVVLQKFNGQLTLLDKAERSDSYEPQRGGGGSTPRDEFNVDEGDSIPFASAWGLR